MKEGFEKKINFLTENQSRITSETQRKIWEKDKEINSLKQSNEIICKRIQIFSKFVGNNES